MKLKIYDGSSREPGVVYLRLVETDPDHIAIEAVYDYTTHLPPEEAVYLPGGGLLVITAEGRVALSPNVDPALGFPLDHDGRLQLDGYCEAQTARRGRYQGKRAVLVGDCFFSPPVWDDASKAAYTTWLATMNDAHPSKSDPTPWDRN